MATDISYVVGDATDPSPGGERIIVHIVNTVGAWGRGFVLALSRRWPEPEIDFRTTYTRGGGRTLGRTAIVTVAPRLAVANLYAQEGVRSAANPTPIRYDALRACLASLAIGAPTAPGLSVHMPRIGCGLAGGRWEEVEPIIRETLCAADVPVTVYDLAARRV